MPAKIPLAIEKQGQIYKIVCTINNKIYIGQTHAYSKNKNNFKKYGYVCRFNKHVSEAYGICENRSWKLNNAIKKYGKNNFNIELLHECNPKFLNYFEKLFISEYNSVDNGYNITKGGFSFKPTKETIEKRSKTLANKNSDKRREYFSQNTDKIHSAYITLIDNKSIKNIRLDVTFKDNKIIKYRYSVEDNIEEIFDRVYNDIIHYIDSNNLYIAHELQNKISIDRLKTYTYNLDDIKNMVKTLKCKNNLQNDIEKRYSKFKDLVFTEISIRIINDRNIYMIYVFFKTDKYSRKGTRFGGSEINILYAYKQALEFANKLANENKIIIRDDVQNIIRLLNEN